MKSQRYIHTDVTSRSNKKNCSFTKWRLDFHKFLVYVCRLIRTLEERKFQLRTFRNVTKLDENKNAVLRESVISPKNNKFFSRRKIFSRLRLTALGEYIQFKDPFKSDRLNSKILFNILLPQWSNG